MKSDTLGRRFRGVGTRLPPVDGRRLRLWTIVFFVRAVSFASLGVAALIVPAVGSDRFWISALLLGLATPYNLVLITDLRRNHRLRPSTVFLDIFGASIFHLWFDGVWTSVLLILLASVALAAVGFDRKLAFWATGFATAAIATVGALSDIADPIVGVLSFLIAALMVILTVGIVADSERQLRLRFTGLVEGVDAVVWEADLYSMTLNYVSPRAETMFGYPLEDWAVPGFFTSCIHPDDRDGVMAGVFSVLSERDDLQIEFRVNALDGRVVWVRNFMRAVPSDLDKFQVVRGVMVDISSQKADEQLIGQYSDIVENMQVGLFVWQLPDQDDCDSLRLVAGNPAAWFLLGRSIEAVVGGSFSEVFPELAESNIASRVAEVIKTGLPEIFDQIDYLNSEGVRVAMFLRVFPLPNDCAGFAFEDVTTRMHAEEALRYQAMHDSLTGLPNRSLFNERLGWVLAEGSRRYTQVALLLIDLDQFKEVNDTLGHLVGDELLRQVAQRLRLLLRESDMIARFGGDEFAVLLTTTADETAAREVAGKIVTAFSEPFQLNNVVLHSSSSIGIALFPDHGTDSETLVQRADVAMYMAKRAGSGFAFYIADDDRTSIDRLKLLGEMHRAVEGNELEVYYQPKISLFNGDVVDIEALVRWRHPEQGLLRPAAFIELAELSGAVQSLGRQVISTGLNQHGLWSSLDLGVGLAVNLSIRNLYDPTLIEHLIDEFNRCKVDPGEVVIELSERDLMGDPSQVTAALVRLTDMGVRLSIDDFGTGSSSLSSLRDLPVNELKIDRSLISSMLNDDNSNLIVRSIIDLGRNFGFTIVAEGVESSFVLDYLIDLGCDQAQGFKICEPLSAEELLTWFEHRGGPSGWGSTRV